MYLFLFSIAVQADFSLIAVSRGYSLVAACGLLPAVASLVAECGLWSAGSVVWLTDLAALWHTGSSWTREQSLCSISKWILTHCTIREVLSSCYIWGNRFREFESILRLYTWCYHQTQTFSTILKLATSFLSIIVSFLSPEGWLQL